MSTEEIKAASNSMNKDNCKSFIHIIVIRTKWFFHPTRNFVANLNSFQLSYLLGWLMSLLTIIVSILYLLFFSKVSFYWFYLTTLITGISFISGFFIDLYLLWVRKNAFFRKTISIIGLILSPISYYFARCIFVDITALEAPIASQAVILLSLFIVVFLWFCVSAIILQIAYYTTLFLSIFIQSIIPLIFGIFIPFRNSSLYLYWLRKKKVKHIEKKATKIWISFILVTLSRALGAGLISSMLFFAFTYIPSIVESSYGNKIIESIIIHADYRPENKISECTNLEKDEWGLLVGYNKISVAHPQELGRYTFKTKPCLFTNDM